MLSWEKKLEGISTDRESYTTCFGCGPDNPIGLKLVFTHEDGKAVSEFTLGDNYQGWNGCAHGGIICTILDEAMAHACHPVKGVTARMEVRLRHPAPIDVPMIVIGKFENRAKKPLTTSAVVTLADGTIIAESTGTTYVID